MLPASMLGTTYLNWAKRGPGGGAPGAGAARPLPAAPSPPPLLPTISPLPPARRKGSPVFQAVSPFLRNLTVTVALRLSSPPMRQSKPSEIRVGRSTFKAPAVTLSAAWADAQNRHAAANPDAQSAALFI